MSISFANRVAIVTGAGGGLGRAYARELARRGAKVVVNDLGGSRDGTGTSDAAAKVVAEIEAEGGEAMANGGSVTDYAQMEAMVSEVKDRWGRVDILINNAGVLRDKSFTKMTIEDFDFVIKTHLYGSAIATKAVWETMREQSYGRIVMTSSSSGLFGNFGQANYGAAKMGIVGLAKTLYLEGVKYDIRVNTIAPAAATRMTQDIPGAEALTEFIPEQVAPGALFLASENAPNNVILGAGGGGFHGVWVDMNVPVVLDGDSCSVEGVAENWAAIMRRDETHTPPSGQVQVAQILQARQAQTDD